jgi:hypothetical protein
MLHPSREGIAKISRSFAGIRYCAPLLFTDRIMTSLLCRINVRTLAAWRGIKWLRGCKCVVRHDLIKRTGGAPRAVKRPEDIYALTPLRFQGYGSSGEAEWRRLRRAFRCVLTLMKLDAEHLDMRYRARVFRALLWNGQVKLAKPKGLFQESRHALAKTNANHRDWLINDTATPRRSFAIVCSISGLRIKAISTILSSLFASMRRVHLIEARITMRRINFYYTTMRKMTRTLRCCVCCRVYTVSTEIN